VHIKSRTCAHVDPSLTLHLCAIRAWGALVLGECVLHCENILEDEQEQAVTLGLLNRYCLIPYYLVPYSIAKAFIASR
jgi:hypothetical protein